MILSAQERNLICLYHSGSRVETMRELYDATLFIDEPDVLAAADSAVHKLDAMSDAAFVELVAGEASA